MSLSNLVHVEVWLTSLSPCKRNCSARFWNRGADGVIGIAAAKTSMVARAMKKTERILVMVNVTTLRAWWW
jgi:hypothetical protein